MLKIYVYVLDTMADWELGYVTAELHSKRFFKKNAPQMEFKTVGLTTDPIKTMGGMTIIPDCTIDDIEISKSSTLLLPGGDTWNDPKHGAILGKVNELLSADATVCAICGATVALACCGLLDQRPHTSNGVGFLDMVAPGYKGQSFYIDEPAVTDHNLITAACTGSLLWAKQIIEHLGVFQADTLEAWYNYFNTGKAEYFYAMMQSVQHGSEN
ncbi:MAG: type 1 glutamine amidotransferase family protein [bacterium]|nr:type 1 glutamine amidotransferase family protein [bacterium]